MATKRVKRVNGYFTNRRQLPPRYPGGSAERRVCLEDTKKDSSASGMSSRSGADGGAHDPVSALLTTAPKRRPGTTGAIREALKAIDKGLGKAWGPRHGQGGGFIWAPRHGQGGGFI